MGGRGLKICRNVRTHVMDDSYLRRTSQKTVCSFAEVSDRTSKFVCIERKHYECVYSCAGLVGIVQLNIEVD